MAGVGIQTSFKTTADTLVNVQGDSPDEWDMNLAHVLEKVDEIKAAEAAIKGTPPSGVALLEKELGAQVIREYDTPPAAAPSGYAQTHCNRCGQSPVCPTCNRPCKVEPLSLKNGQYWKHECPSGDRDHKTVWCNLPK